MDVPYDKAVGESSDGMHQNIPADCLDDILNKFWTIRFYTFPFLSGADSFIGDRLATELVFADTRLYIAKSSTGSRPTFRNQCGD